MFIIKGRRFARIKKYKDYGFNCNSCGIFDIDVNVYKSYYHVFFLPICATGETEVKMHCGNCSQPIRFDSVAKRYEEKTKSPFYLYTGILLVIALVATIIIMNIVTQKQKADFVANPQVGDVYQITNNDKNLTTYCFLRVSKVSGDTISVFHNTLQYINFVTKFNEDDYFEKNDEISITKQELKTMLDKDKINAVERGYGSIEGFNRVK